MKTTKTMKRFDLLVAIFFVLYSGYSYAQVHLPYMEIPFTKTLPVIDGKIGATEWQNSAELSGFTTWTLDSYVKDPVTVYLCFDEKFLYAAFRNSDTKANELNNSVKPNRPWDTFLWGTNFASIEIRYKDKSFRVMADPKQTMTDFKNGDILWNGNWKYAASINQSDWTAEFKIPFSDIGLTGPPSNTELTLSLSRSFPTGESADWSGTCKLAGTSGASYKFGLWPDPVPGKNILTFEARNPGTKSQEVICELELIPLNSKPEFINQTGQGASSDLQIVSSKVPITFKYNFTIPTKGALKKSLEYDLPVEGSYYASATIKSKNGTLISRIKDYSFTLEPNRKKIKELKLLLGECQAPLTRVSNPVADRLRAEAGKAELSLLQLEKYADTAWKSGQWNELTKQVATKDRELAQLLHKVKWTALNNWGNEDDFAIACTHSILKLRRDAIFPEPLSEQIDVSLARSEYESVQLAILPFGKDINQLTLDVSDLKSADGSIISKSNIELSLVDYNKIDWQPAYLVDYKGWYPDPLLPLNKAVNISGTEVCRPIWITLFAPAGTAGGDYTGTISVNAAGMKKITVTVKCHVWNFDLPVASHLKTHSWDEKENMTKFYNLEELPLEWYQRFCGLLLKNRLNPGYAGVNYLSEEPDKSGNYDFSKVEKVLKYSIDRGLTRFSIIQMKKGIYTTEEAEKAYRFLDAYAKFLREKGWLDKALVELWDEPTDLEWPLIKERGERVKKIDLGLRLQLFAEHGPYDFWDKETDKYGLNNLIDIWAPINAVEAPEAQAKGTEIWAYFATLPRENSPNFYIDRPAIYQRSIAWYCWMYGLDGFEHWGTTYFWRNVKAGEPMDKKWPNVPWDSRTYHFFDGEGQLVYPGPDGVPYSSVRLENFRDGMDDYEYLYRLRDLLSFFKDSNDPELNSFRQLLSPEDYLLYKYPRNTKMTLENTLRFPDQPEKILETRKKIAEAIEILQKRLQAGKK